MDPVSVEMERQVPSAGTAPFRPSASMWLWRPWYAKVWWVAIAIYWCGRVASYWNGAAAEFYSTSFAGILNIAFFPPAAMLILSIGFARAWFAWSGWEFGEPTDQTHTTRPIGGLKDRYSDPLDPQSGLLHWKHFHPDN